MDLYLKEKTAIVTGASQGLGRAITKELALEGVRVLAVARNENLLRDLRHEVVQAGGIEPLVLVQDFVAPDAPEKIADTAQAAFGHTDILVNNAGRSRPLDVIGSEDEWSAALTLDFDRHRQLTQKVLPAMMNRKQGVVLNVISTYELRAINASAVYKASVVVWSKQLAGQLGQHGIRINCLQPGLIDTANIRRVFTAEERMEFSRSGIPLGDFGQPQDVANMAAFLVSPRASYITGTVAVVDGGMRYHPF